MKKRLITTVALTASAALLAGCMAIYKNRTDVTVTVPPQLQNLQQLTITLNQYDSGMQDATLSKSVTPTTTATIPLK